MDAMVQPQTRLDEVEEEIETLRERLATFGRATALSHLAIWGGGAVLLLVLTLGSFRTPAMVFGSIAAVLGGIVWLGATKASREDAEGKLADAEAQRSRLFDEVAARNGWRDLTPTIH